MSRRSLGDIYELIIGLFLAGGVLSALASVGLPNVLETAEFAGYPPKWVAAAMLSFVMGAWLAGWHHAGPLANRPGDLQWHLTRQHPKAMQRRHLLGCLVASALIGAVVAAMASPSLEFVGTPQLATSVIIWSALQILTVLTLRSQRHDVDWLGRLAALVWGIAGIAALAGATWGVGVGAAIAVGYLAISVVVQTSRRFPRPLATELTPQWQLVRGGQNRSAIAAGVTMVDVETFRIARLQHTTTARRLLPASVYGTTQRTVRASLVVLLRNLRVAALITATALPLVLAVDELFGVRPAVVFVALAEYALAVTMARSAEIWANSTALARTWAIRKQAMGVALAAPGVIACAVLVLITWVGVSMPPPVGVLLLALPVAILWRRRSVHQQRDETTLFSTPMGALSVQAVNRLAAGPDVVLLALLVSGALI